MNHAEIENTPSLSRRALAYAIDFLILVGITDALRRWALPMKLDIGQVNIESSETALAALITYFYSGYFLHRFGQTVGRMALGVYVVDCKTGGPIGFIRAGLRDSLGRNLSISIMGIGYLIAFFREDRRTLHDLIFSTRVVRKRSEEKPISAPRVSPTITYDPQLPLDLR
jgi:uncharacterized RDD family membrane protein YckC